MNPSDYRICLDVQQPHGAVELDMKQGDTNRRICITLTDGGRPYLPGEGCCAVFTAKKPDEKVIYNQCAVENNTVVYGVTAQTTACAGTVRCELRLYSREPQLDEQGRPIPSEDCQLLTSAAFTIAVHPQVCQDADVVASVPESTVLEALVSVAETAIEECETATQQAGTVASYADQASDHARREAENAAEAAAKANAVAQQVQEKLDSGAFIGPQGEKGDPGQVNIDDSTVTGDSTWSSEKITEFVTETSALVQIDYDEASGLVTVNRTHAEIAALVNNGTHLQVQLFYMETAGDETLAVNGMWMKRDLYGDAFVFCFSGIGDFVLQSDDTAFWVSPPGNLRYDAAQELTEAQQAQARENIGAIADGDSVYSLEIGGKLHVDQDADIDLHDNRVKGVASGEQDTDAVNKKQLDDAQIELIDKLCPAFSESGAVVSCEPVEGYPLQAVSQIAPVQSGSGTPSPDNIRSFVQSSAVQLTRLSGKNLLGGDALADRIVAAGGEKDAQAGTVAFSPNLVDTTKPLLNRFKENTQYTVVLYGINSETETYANMGIKYTDNTLSPIRFQTAGEESYAIFTTEAGKTVSKMSIVWYDGHTTLYYDKCGVFEGVISQEEFESYKGDTFTMALGQSIYGGSLDWTTGVLSIEYGAKVFDGASTNRKFVNTDSSDGSYAYTKEYPAGLTPRPNGEVYANQATRVGLYGSQGTTMVVTIPTAYTGATDTDSEATVVEKFNTLVKTWYDAGTPLIVVYELATPTQVQLTPQEIKALAGVNTVYSDTGDTEVTGRADPVAEMQKLKNAILALGGNV